MILRMQSGHFWYQGRHRFLLHSLLRRIDVAGKRAIDLGGGVGGWVNYLDERLPARPGELALADSSETALQGAQRVLSDRIALYQVDLLDLHWNERWDIAFLLDVIEHCPDDRAILAQVHKSLKPGGQLFVTVPAFMSFWSFSDEAAHHLRRYRKDDFSRLARETGFELIDARYFMFFLSPLYWLARKLRPASMSASQKEAAIRQERVLPNRFVNEVLATIFKAETPLGNYLSFPWGTSLLGVFRKP